METNIFDNMTEVISGLPEMGRLVEFVERWGDGRLLEGNYKNGYFHSEGRSFDCHLDVVRWRYKEGG